jgi:hypothetical protein
MTFSSYQAPYGLAADLALGLAIGEDAVALEVDDEQLARLEAPLVLDVELADREHAGLGREQHVAALREDPATRAQAVAVERRTDGAAVGEAHRRRPVPRLHEAGLVGVEVTQVRGQLGVVLPRGRDHHHRRVRERAAGHDEQLHHAVERRRVRQARANDRQQLLEVVGPEQLGVELGLAGTHPVDVAHQRVDLAVVGDHPVRVGELPARERVGREARVRQRHPRPAAAVAKVGEEVGELEAREHPLVDDRARRHRRHEQVGRGALGHAADDEQLALEGVLVERVRGADEQLADARRGLHRRLARARLVDRDVPPRDDLLALLDDRALEHLLEL